MHTYRVYFINIKIVTEFEKSHLQHNATDCNYLKCYTYLEKDNRCLHKICHNSIAIYTLFIHQLLNR